MKQVIKVILSYVAYYLRLWHLVFWLYPIFKGRPVLYVLMFHRVAPQEKTADFVSRYNRGQDKDNYELTLKELSKYFEFINLNQFTDIVTGQTKPDKNSVLITFDDADSDFYEYAYPMLKNNNWPAVMFAPTRFIETENRFWHLTITNMIQNFDDKIWQKLRLEKKLFDPQISELINEYETYDSSLKLPLCRKLLYIMDSMDVKDVKSSLENFKNIFDPEYTLGIKCMNWAQLKEISNNNIDVASHTVAHWKLPELEADQQKEELAASKNILETKLGHKVTAFCYPSGAHNDETAKFAHEAGYAVSFVTEPGRCQYPLKGLDLMKIKRIGISGIDKFDLNFEIGRLII